MNLRERFERSERIYQKNLNDPVLIRIRTEYKKIMDEIESMPKRLLGKRKHKKLLKIEAELNRKCKIRQMNIGVFVYEKVV